MVRHVTLLTGPNRSSIIQDRILLPVTSVMPPQMAVAQAAAADPQAAEPADVAEGHPVLSVVGPPATVSC